MFQGKVALVTGSTSGIGQATALLFAKRGAQAVIHGQSKERLQNTLQLFKQNGIPESQLHVVMGPITKDETQKSLIEETVEKFGRLDILVNNAGVLQKEGLDTYDVRNLDYLWDVNFRSVFTLSQLARSHLAKNKGNIVNVSSASSTLPFPNFGCYAIVKAALDHHTRISALTFAEDGIRVNSVNPGFIPTRICQSVGAPSEDEFEVVMRPFIDNLVPQRRFGAPIDAAEVICFLASPKANFITGSHLLVDGGIDAGTAVSKAKKDGKKKKAKNST